MTERSSGVFKVRKVLVTGATGFAGSHILEALSRVPGIRPIAACRHPGALPAEVCCEVREGDLRDANYIKDVCRGVDVVIHAAAWTSLYGHRESSQRLYFQPTLGLIEAARQAGVKVFINTSTASAAAPERSSDPYSPGVEPPYWPHLCNLVRIENILRGYARDWFKVINLRMGIYVGRRYRVGFLPILLPRLKTRLIPWIRGGKTSLPLIDGRDIGQAFSLAAQWTPGENFAAFNIVGSGPPSVREVIEYIADRHQIPKPCYSVPFPVAYGVGELMELIDPLMPFDPLVTRSLIHLLEETGADNSRATAVLGYQPQIDWRRSIDEQIEEICRQKTLAPMHNLLET
ncbi:NAD-dependent epimerase/dehydratase family protein [Hahella sp. HN01]|uniref:NAD-dependent epimerase/dehydratase family protein n=1 Tax=unclassified Hahella TaxID=2624107 RepID=UPI001C1EB406|nr:NAD(P)-dependent oxidoreductase [Hahella sp. HN01]MBU6950868.1 NAD(P)-dependent oxidoreductase [Hahella sp. HN01]